MRRLWPLIAVLMLAGSIAAPAPAVAVPTDWDIRHYTTGDSSELVSTIPVHTSNGSNYRVIYCLDLGDAPAGGEILLANAHMQVTIPHFDTVAVSTQLYLASNCTATGGDDIGEAQGTNLSRQIHHLNVNRSGSITVPTGNNRRYVSLLAWSASTTALPGHYLTVDSDYGRLDVIRYTRA